MLFPFSLTYILSLYSEQLSEMGIITLFYGGESCVLVKYWAGQKVCSGFSIRWYELSGQLNNMSKTAQFLSSGDTIFNHFHLTPKLLFSLAVLKVCQRFQHLCSKLLLPTDSCPWEQYKDPFFRPHVLSFGLENKVKDKQPCKETKQIFLPDPSSPVTFSRREDGW